MHRPGGVREGQILGRFAPKTGGEHRLLQIVTIPFARTET